MTITEATTTEAQPSPGEGGRGERLDACMTVLREWAESATDEGFADYSHEGNGVAQYVIQMLDLVEELLHDVVAPLSVYTVATEFHDRMAQLKDALLSAGYLQSAGPAEQVAS